MHQGKRKDAFTVYVSPLGRDSWSGRFPEATDDNGDGPFASLNHARDALRKVREHGHSGPVRVILRGGVYFLSEPLELDSCDGGGVHGDVTWEAYADEQPCLDGGRQLTGWRILDEYPAALPRVAQGKVMVADIPRGWFFSRLYWDGKPLSRAVSVIEDNWRKWPLCELGADPDAEIRIPPATLPVGDDVSHAVLNFLPTPYTRWSNALAPITGVDRDHGIVHHIAFKLPRPERTTKIPFRLENVLSGLVEEGRWFVDSSAGLVYLWPPSGADPEKHNVVAPFLTTLLSVTGKNEPVRHVCLRGLTCRHSRMPDGHAGFGAPGTAVVLKNAEDCRVENCRFLRLGSTAVMLRNTRDCRVSGCDIADAGGAGVVVRGGTGLPPFSSTDNCIENCTIRRCGQLNMHSAGIVVGAAEKTRIAHNLVHDMPYIGILVGGGPRHTYYRGWPREFPELQALWNEHGEGSPTIDSVKRFTPGYNVVEKNIVHHVMRTLDDGAAIYCHAGHHESVLHNVVYAMESPRGMGLYFDDEQMDSVMQGNLVYHCPATEQDTTHAIVVHLHHNGRNRVLNNILVGGKQVLSVPAGYGGHCIERNILVWNGTPDWDRADPKPERGPGDGRRQEGWDAGASTVGSNLWWSWKGREFAEELLAVWKDRGYGQGSLAADPLFENPEKGDYRLKKNSPAFGLGFKQLEIDDAGPE